MNLNSNTNASLSSVLKKLQDRANTSFEESHPIPAEANHSAEFYKHERNKVLPVNGFALAGKMKYSMKEII